MDVKGYTDKTKVELFLGKTITENIDDFIATAEVIIDNITGRNFIADSADSAKLFSGDGSCLLLIDDCVSVSKVEVGDDDFGGSFTEVQPVSSSNYDGYFTLPDRLVDNRGRNIPITMIKLRSRTFIRGVKNHRITAKWGYSVVVPHDIEFSATVIAGGIYNSERGGSAGTGAIKSEKIGNYSVSYDVESVNSSGSWSDFARAKEILESYKKFVL